VRCTLRFSFFVDFYKYFGALHPLPDVMNQAYILDCDGIKEKDDQGGPFQGFYP